MKLTKTIISLLFAFSTISVFAIQINLKAKYPGEAYRQSTVATDNYLYVLDEDGFYQYSAKEDSWQKKADFPITHPRELGGCVAIGEKVYFGFGRDMDYNYIKMFYVYDPTSDSWSTTKTFPDGGRYAPNFFTFNKSIYVFGGTDQDKVEQNNMWKYDTTSDNWTEVTPIPEYPNRFMQATFSNSEGVFVGSGEYIDVTSYKTYLLSDLWQYWPNEDKWTYVSDFKFNTYSSAFTIGETAYMWDTYMARLYSYNIPGNTRSFVGYLFNEKTFYGKMFKIGNQVFLFGDNGELYEVDLGLTQIDIEFSIYTVDIDEYYGINGFLGSIFSDKSSIELEFKLVPDDKGNNWQNNYFEIRNSDELYLAKQLDYETNDTMRICVEASHSSGATSKKVFAIPVKNVNEAPYIIGLSDTVIYGNTYDTWSSLISSNNYYSNSPYLFSLCDANENYGADSAYFAIDGEYLKCNTLPEISLTDSFFICIKVTGSNKETRKKNFVINLQETNGLNKIGFDQHIIKSFGINQIVLNSSFLTGNCSARVYDLNGSLQETTFDNSIKTVYTQNLPKGIYILKIETCGKQYVVKFNKL